MLDAKQPGARAKGSMARVTLPIAHAVHLPLSTLDRFSCGDGSLVCNGTCWKTRPAVHNFRAAFGTDSACGPISSYTAAHLPWSLTCNSGTHSTPSQVRRGPQLHARPGGQGVQGGALAVHVDARHEHLPPGGQGGGAKEDGAAPGAPYDSTQLPWQACFVCSDTL